MDDLTQERYGPLTERDLWNELHPDLPMPRRLYDAARARVRRERLLDLDGTVGGGDARGSQAA